VTRKITRAAARLKMGLADAVYLGNLDARRDWGFAGRPAEGPDLCADISKARRVLGWEPRTGFRELVTMMVDGDMEALARRLKGGRQAIC
jgi:GDP-D-mannose dehydratase